MPKITVSRRNVLTGATAAATAIGVPITAQAMSLSTELLDMNMRLLAAREKRDALDAIVKAAASKRPPVPQCIERREFKGMHHSSELWRRCGNDEYAEIAEAYETGLQVADEKSGYRALNEALEAAVEVVGDIEGEIIDFEPLTMADLKLQVELGIHQEVVDHGMCDDLPMLIFRRFLRIAA